MAIRIAANREPRFKTCKVFLSSSAAHWSAEHLRHVDIGGDYSLEVSTSRERRLSGTIPNAVGSWSNVEGLTVSYTNLRGPIPDAVRSMIELKFFRVDFSSLSGCLPAVLASMLKMEVLAIIGNRQNGTIPIAFTGMTRLWSLHLGNNQLTGSLPDVAGSLATMRNMLLVKAELSGAVPDQFACMRRLGGLDLQRNKLSGSLPSSLACLGQARMLNLQSNALSGSIPSAVAHMTSVVWFHLHWNRLSGSIPDSLAPLRGMQDICLQENRLSGSMPDSLAQMTGIHNTNLRENRLSGSLPSALACLRALEQLFVGENMLSGEIPEAIIFMEELGVFTVAANQLSGAIPVAVTSLSSLWGFVAHDNRLSGPMPNGLFLEALLIIGNRLTGTFPAFERERLLMVSDNLLEGTLSNIVSLTLRVLDVSGAAGSSGDFRGPLPSALCRASELKMIAAANHQMEGVIPLFASTLSLLALQRNRFKVFPDIPLAHSVAVLLHSNHLSCGIPWCGNAAARQSIIAIGNHLQHPKGKFPAWVTKFEQDPLLWVSGTEGMSLVHRVNGACGFFVLAVVLKLGRNQLLSVISKWQIGPTTHLWVVKTSSRLVSCMVKDCLSAVVFLMSLLFWDLYTCPQTLATTSACLRSSVLIRTMVFLFWCRLCFHDLAVKRFKVDGGNQKKQQTMKMLRKRLIVVAAVVCVDNSSLNVRLFSTRWASPSPAFFHPERSCRRASNSSIGIFQGLVGKFVLPVLASKVTWEKHVFITVSKLDQ